MKIKLIKFDVKGDDRGSLIAIEGQNSIPFDIKRVYYIYGTQLGIRRGFHAHLQLQQCAICISGSCKILLDDTTSQQIVNLDSCEKGLIIDKMIWHEMYDFSKDCVLMVLASDFYNESDYIRNYDEFLKLSH